MDSSMLQVHLKKQWKGFGLDVSFGIPRGRITVLFGPSGAGKSTVLRLIAGLDIADDGKVLHGKDVWFDASRGINVSPQHRSAGFVFQDYALFPHLTVEKNVAYGVKGKGAANTVKELILLIGLSGYEHCYPAQLSGGQKQRVALVRAMARKPDLLLLDEPLSALDWETRVRLQTDLKQIINRFQSTALYVTHDVSEVYKLADYVIVMESGKIVKQGAPDDVFLDKRLSTRIQVVGKVIGIEHDTIMSTVTVLHADQFFKALIDREEIEELCLQVGDDVVVGAKSSDVILFKLPKGRI